MSRRRGVVILTALNLEYEAVLSHLTGMGNRASAIIAERAITEFSPAAIMFVGVAGG